MSNNHIMQGQYISAMPISYGPPGKQKSNGNHKSDRSRKNEDCWPLKINGFQETLGCVHLCALGNHFLFKF